MNLTYEDCKELKDAGFSHSDWRVISYDSYPPILAFCNPPTLSELIEACGLQFMSLIAPCVYDENWIAWGSNYKEEGRRSKGTGSSPEQAVKNLWLALNK